MVHLFLFLRANCKYPKSFVNDCCNDAAAVQPRCWIRTIEHQMEEVCALVVEKDFLDPWADDRWLVSLADKAHPRVTKCEDRRQIVIDVSQAGILFVVREEVKHDFVSNFQCHSVHFVEILNVLEGVLVLSHAQISWYVLQGQLYQVKELGVEHLTVDDELDVVLLNHRWDPIRHMWLYSSIFDIVDNLFSICGFLANLYLSDVSLKLLLVNEHISWLAPWPLRRLCNVLLIGIQASLPAIWVVLKVPQIVKLNRTVIEKLPVIFIALIPSLGVDTRVRFIRASLRVDHWPVVTTACHTSVDVYAH